MCKLSREFLHSLGRSLPVAACPALIGTLLTAATGRLEKMGAHAYVRIIDHLLVSHVLIRTICCGFGYFTSRGVRVNLDLRSRKSRLT